MYKKRTYTSDDEGEILLGVEILDRCVECRWEGILKEPRQVRVLDALLDVADDFLPSSQP